MFQRRILLYERNLDLVSSPLVHHAALHHERHPAQQRDVRQRVAPHRHDVRVVARRDAASSASRPRSRAASTVALRIAWAGVIPPRTMRTNSSAFSPWGKTPASVPKAMSTPARTAALIPSVPWACAATFRP